MTNSAFYTHSQWTRNVISRETPDIDIDSGPMSLRVIRLGVDPAMDLHPIHHHSLMMHDGV